MKIDEKATKDARARHEAGIARLNKMLGLSDEMIEAQTAFFARRAAARERRRARRAEA